MYDPRVNPTLVDGVRGTQTAHAIAAPSTLPVPGKGTEKGDGRLKEKSEAVASGKGGISAKTITLNLFGRAVLLHPSSPLRRPKKIGRYSVITWHHSYTCFGWVRGGNARMGVTEMVG